VIEARSPGYVRYRRDDGARWEVRGTCDRNGACLLGSVIAGELITGPAHLADLCARLGRDRPDSDLDVPVGPGFRGCCPLRIIELEAAG
jgi:hypothetical protein